MLKRLFFGGVLTTLALFAFQGNALTFAETGVDFSINVSEAVLQLTVPGSTSITLNPISSAAVFDSTSFNVSVATNNASGYSLIMSVPTANLTHSTITGNDAPVISTLSTTASRNNFPANAWGYSIVEDVYNPVLLTNVPASWSEDGPTNGTNYPVTLGASVDGAKMAGSYENTLTFSVIVNPDSIRDSIVFDGNGADDGAMDNQYIYQGTPTNLHPNAYTKTGYSFCGWNTRADGLGDGYGDKDSFISPIKEESGTTTLYAQWTDASPVCVENCSGGGTPKYESSISIARAFELAYTEHHLGMYEETAYGNGVYQRVDSWNGEPYKNYDVRFAMQDIDLTYNGVKVCDLVTVIGDQYQALDVRDNKLYFISKLADGKCWMTQNLDLDLDTNTTLSSNTTDLNTYNTNGYVDGYSTNNNVIYWTPVNSTMALSGTSITGWGRSNYVPYSGNRGDIYHYLDQTDSLPFAENGKHGHEGNFYSYSAAIASNDSTNIRGVAEEASNSICPAGWRLPLARTSEHMNLYTLYGQTMLAIESSPLYFIRAGMADAYNNRFRESQGWYATNNLYSGSWSRYIGTCYNSFAFGAPEQNLGYFSIYCDNPGRAMGQSIRCVAR